MKKIATTMMVKVMHPPMLNIPLGVSLSLRLRLLFDGLRVLLAMGCLTRLR